MLRMFAIIHFLLMLCCLSLPGCLTNEPASPSGHADVRLELVFPVHGLSGPQAKASGSVIDQVQITILRKASRTAVVANRELPIIQEGGQRFAEAELSIPVSEDDEDFIISVTAQSIAQQLALAGFTEFTLNQAGSGPMPVIVVLRNLVSIAQEGTVTASSIFNSAFIPDFSVDGDLTTSWFSAGVVDGNSSTYIWTSEADQLFSAVSVINNQQHAAVRFREGFGFRTITFQVLDANQAVVFEETVDYPANSSGQAPGTAVVAPLVRGRSVRLLLNEHQDPICGGFSELLIIGLRGSVTDDRSLQLLLVEPGSESAVVGEQIGFRAVGVLGDNTQIDLTDRSTWMSDNESVATINDRGVATAIGAGRVKITAANSGFIGEAFIDVADQ